MQNTKEEQRIKFSKLIKEWEWAVKPVFGNFSYAQDMYTAEVWLRVRDLIKEAQLENHPEVVKLDRELLRRVLKYGAESGDRRKPLSDWWWHLDLIAKKQYPAELLPEELRKEYERAQNKRFLIRS